MQPDEFEHETHDRALPQDLLAEQSVLGGMMLSPSVVDEVCEVVSAEAFYNPRHSIVFETILSLRSEGLPADSLAVVARLAESGILPKVGGGPYIHELTAAVPTAANAPYYARIVADRARLRQVIETGTQLVQYGYNPGGREADEIVNLAQSAISEFTLGRRAHSVAEFSDFLDDNLASILAEDRDSRGLSTGLGILDDVIGGLKGGQLIVVAARPGMGKTIHAVDMLRASAIRKAESVLMFSLEMSKEDIQKRILAAEAEVNLARITNGGLRADERARLTAVAERLRGCFIHIDDTAEVDLAHIRTTARKVAADKGLALMVIDYLQLMGTGGNGQNRATELGAVSRGLKVLARELDIPIVACAQLNRGSEQRTDKRPQLSDLRESGAIEQDADVVELLFRPDYSDPEHVRAGEVDLIVAKNRNGPIETVSAIAQLAWARFVDPNI